MSQTLHLPTHLLRTDLIRPGDVLLTRAEGKESTLIAWLSRHPGQFSHAALCINQGLTFESDGELIRFKPITWLGWGKVNNERTRLGQIPDNPTKCAIFRHPEMASVDAAKFAASLESEIDESFGKDYSELYRLVRLAKLPVSIISFAVAATKLYETFKKQNQVPGAFCSELVSRFFSRLGLKLFDETRLPSDISPNALANSKLRHEQDLVVEPKDVEDFSDEDALHLTGSDLAAKIRRKQRELSASLEEVKDLTRTLKEKSTADFVQLKTNFENNLGVVAEILKESILSGRAEGIRRAVGLCRKAAEIGTALPNVADPQRAYVDDSFWQRLAEFDNSLLRCRALVSISDLKARESKLTGDIVIKSRETRKWMLMHARNVILTNLRHS